MRLRCHLFAVHSMTPCKLGTRFPQWRRPPVHCKSSRRSLPIGAHADHKPTLCKLATEAAQPWPPSGCFIHAKSRLELSSCIATMHAAYRSIDACSWCRGSRQGARQQQSSVWRQAHYGKAHQQACTMHLQRKNPEIEIHSSCNIGTHI